MKTGVELLKQKAELFFDLSRGRNITAVFIGENENGTPIVIEVSYKDIPMQGHCENICISVYNALMDKLSQDEKSEPAV